MINDNTQLRLLGQPVAFSNLVDVIQYHLARVPDHPVLRFMSDGDTVSGTLSYRDLDHKARALASYLVTHTKNADCKEQPRALLAFNNGLEFIVAFYACLYAGVIAVPVYPPQNRLSYLERLDLIASDCQAEFILGLSDYFELVDDKFSQVPYLSGITKVAVDTSEAQQILTVAQLPIDRMQAKDLAFFQYTSGSTAAPKGVMVSHRNLLHNIGSMQDRFDHDESDVIVSWLPMFHDMGLIGAVLQAICIGAQVIAMTPAAFLQRPMRWLYAIDKFRGTTTFAPNFAYALVAERAKPEDLAALDLSCWLMALNGAEPIRPATLKAFTETFAECGFAATTMYPGYGLAEATLFVSGSPKGQGPFYIEVDADVYEQDRRIELMPPRQTSRTLVSSGQPCDWHMVEIVDPDTHQLCDEGEIGEIWVHSDSVALGYWQHPEKTQETFKACIKESAEHQGRYFMRTGDYGFLYQKELFISGRMKEVIIIRGANYYPQAIEEAVQQVDEGLKDNAGAAFTFEHEGEETLVMVQEVARTAVKTIDVAKVCRLAKQTISEQFGLTLHELVLLKPATLPKTSSGKIQRTKAQLQYAKNEGLRIFARSADLAPPEVPQAPEAAVQLTQAEQDMCSMVQMLLATHAKMMPAEVPLDVPVTALGLDSLAIARVSESLKMISGVPLTLEQLLTCESVLDVARLILAIRAGENQAAAPQARAEKKLEAGPFKLSQNQQQLWLLQQKDPTAVAYNVPVALSGEFDFKRVGEVLKALQAVHPQLSCTIDAQGHQQSSNPEAEIAFERHAKWQDLDAQLNQLARRPFDLSVDGVYRVSLLEGATGIPSVLLFNFHHIAVDLLSVLQYIQQFLDAYCHGVASVKPPQGKQYAEFVQWQQDFAGSEAGQKAKRYWRSVLDQDLPLLQLPLDKIRPDIQQFAGDSCQWTLDSHLTGTLRSLAREHRVTLNTVLLSVYQVFLSKLCYQFSFNIGVLNAGRPAGDYGDTLGYFVQPAPFAVTLNADLDIATLLAQTQQQMLSVVNHQAGALNALLSHQGGHANPAVPPVFQTLFNYYPQSELGLLPFHGDNITTAITAYPQYAVHHVASPGSQLDLSLLVADAGDSLQMRFEYNTALFERDTIKAFTTWFSCVAASLAEGSCTLLRELALTKPAGGWCRASAATPSTDVALQCQDETNVCDRIMRHRGDDVAVQLDNAKYTYDQLQQAVNALAAVLIERYPIQSVIALGCYRSFEMIVAILGIQRAGCAYMPLDPDQPDDRLQYCIETAQSKAVLTDGESVGRFERIIAQRDLLNIAELIQPSRAENSLCYRQVGPDDLAYVIFTSGSTGKPKGVMNTHQGLRNRLVWMAETYGIEGSARILQKTPYTFDVSVWELLLPLMARGCLVLARPEGHKDSDYLIETIDRYQITQMHFVPSMLEIFLSHIGANDLSRLGSLKQVFCSGEALSISSQERFFAKLPGCELHNLYGPTEAAIDVTSWQCRAGDDYRSVPIGQSMANIDLLVLDLYAMPVPPGVMGELFISGLGLARGYINRDDLTAERFVANPFAKSDDPEPFKRMYQTGDLVRYHKDGIIEYLGRTDSQVKVRGFRIELAEVDAQILLLPEVKEAVTLVVGEGASARLASYFVLSVVDDEQSEQQVIDQVRDKLSAALPSYMVPDYLTLLDKMPVTANGKLDRRALPEVNVRQSAVFEAPKGEVERQVASAMHEVLGVALKDIGRHSHFFEMGGHSLLAARLAQVLGAAVTMRDVFNAPTVKGLAERFDQEGKSEAVIIHKVAEAEYYPLSCAQSRLWFFHKVNGPSGTYNIPLILRLQGALNKAQLQQNLNRLLQTQSMLRACFSPWDEDVSSPMMSIKDGQCEIEYFTAQPDLQAQLRQLYEAPFYLAEQLPIRVSLIQCGCDEHILLICLHHIVADGHTLALVADALTNGTVVEPPIQYQDFAAWHNDWLDSEQADSQLDYWQKTLSELPPLLPLPTDYPRPPRQRYRGECLPLTIAEHLCKKLQQLANDNDASVYMVMLSAFMVLLARHSHQEDIAVGSPVIGRPDKLTAQLAGYFANTIVVRQNLAEHNSCQSLLEAVKTAVLDAHDNQMLPFDKVVEALQPDRSLSYSPLFQVMFSLEQALDTSCLFARQDIAVEKVSFSHRISKFDLSLMLESDTLDGAVSIEGYIEFNTDLFSRNTIYRLAEQYQQLLCEFVADLGKVPLHLPLMNAAQQTHVLALGQSVSAPPLPQNMASQFAAIVAEYTDEIAVKDSHCQLTYGQLDQSAEHLAIALVNAGVGPDEGVGLYGVDGVARIVALVAIIKAGGYYLPFDVNNPDLRHQYLLQNSGIEVLLYGINSDLPQPLSAVPKTIAVDSKLLCEQRALVDGTLPGYQVNGEHLAYLLFTSGSTGLPKGTLIPQRAVLRLVTQASFMRLDSTTRFIHAAPLAFDASTIEIWGPLLAGGQVICSQNRILTPQCLRRMIADDGANSAWLTSSLFNHLLDQDPHCVCGLEQLLVGGDVVSMSHVQRAYHNDPNITLINGYGPTEATTFTTCYRIPREEAASGTGAVPIGYPIQNTKVYVLDEQMQPVPLGVAGQLYIGGPGLALGYLNLPEQSAKAFIADPFAANSRLYCSGDFVRMDERGCLHYIGRVDGQVKLRGFRIELDEVDRFIAAQPGVKRCACRIAGEGAGKQLVAYLVFDSIGDNQAESVKVLQSRLRDNLPSYMVPGVFQVLDELPLTTNGKLDVKALPPLDLSAVSSTEYSAPKDDIEWALARIWGELFEQEVQKISRHANFFELGGHSLLAARMVAQINQTLDKTLPLAALFEQPVLSELALLCQDADEPEKMPTLKSEPNSRVLSFAQSRVWFIEQAQEPSATYHIPLVLAFDSEVDVDALNRTLIEIVERHQVLRTCYEVDSSGRPQLALKPTADFCIGQQQLQSKEQARIDIAIATFSDEPFNLDKDLPLRAAWLNTEAGDYLMMCFHHIAFDGWSYDIFLMALAEGYNCAVKGQNWTLQTPLQYRDYALWQKAFLQGERQQRQLAYWQQQLAGLPPLLDLPYDRPRPAQQRFVGDCFELTLPDALCAKLLDFSNEHQVSLFMTMLTAFNVFLAKHSGETDIAVGTPMANRPLPELASMLGFFANTMVLRNQVDDDLHLTDLLAQVKQTVLAAHEHQDVPFEALVEQLKLERSLAYNPLFQVMFSLRHEDEQLPEFAGVDYQRVLLAHKVAKFDLSFMLHQSGEQIAGYIEYNTDLFEKATIAEFVERYVHVLEQLVSFPEQTVMQVALARQNLMLEQVTRWNDNALFYTARCIDQKVFDQAQKTPESVAVRDANQSLSYRQLTAKVDALAAYLGQNGVGIDSPVAIYFDRGCQMLVAQLAIMRVGGFYVPLDPKYPAARSEVIVSSAKPKCILTQSHHLAALSEAINIPLMAVDKLLDTLPEVCFQTPARAPRMTAYAIYTSGSTGVPKGIAISHQNAVAMLEWAANEYCDEQLSNVLGATSVCFDLSVYELFLPIQNGGCVTIVDDVLALAEQSWLAAAGITLINTVPSAMEALVNANKVPDSVRTINLAGEPLSRALVDRLYALDHVDKVYNLYGPSEDTTYSTVCLVPNKDQWQAQGIGDKPLIGVPINNTQAYVLDSAGNLQPVGVPGELYLAGDGVTKGYLGQPELTDKVFLSDPFVGRYNRMYRTGDKVVRLKDGQLNYLGRLDLQVKLRGFRIELGELESVALQDVQVRDAVAVVNRTTHNPQLVLYVRLVDDEVADSWHQQLVERLRRALPDYMQPTLIEALDTLPLLPNGKVDRKTLSCNQLHLEELQPFEPPVSNTEIWLAQAWQQLLEGDAVGRQDNFFVRGGHSLLATQLATLIKQQYQLSIAIKSLFQYPVLAEQAAMLDLLLVEDDFGPGDEHGEILDDDDNEVGML